MLRKWSFVYTQHECRLIRSRSSDGSKTIDMFAAAAVNVSTTVPPSKVQGGVLEAASAVTVPSASATGAGIETRGSISFKLAVTGLMAAAFAGLII